MKLKLSFLVACIALLTLSFTFLKKGEQKVSQQSTAQSVIEEPIGGSGSEDQILVK